MRLTNYDIHPMLSGYVEKLWVYETDKALPQSDLHIIVPNGLVKVVIPFKNGLRAQMQGKEKVSSTHEITLIGIADIPSVVSEVKDEPSGTIGIEFSPAGAYRFFSLSLQDITNCVLPLSDLMGKTARALEEQIANTESVQDKVVSVQRFLCSQFAIHHRDEIFEYCIGKIIGSGGRIQVADLERQTGYSSRWLNMKFHTRIGISPKNLSTIVRFQEIYRSWAQTNFTNFSGADVYSFYHDQAHFIKDFKRFTGFSPSKYQLQENDFGKIFYKD
ncbi:helix-turn-helix domain-containing protein [Pseudochryseolinea flava]|uniref:HTH araC/xylS-type domain-containing protein n=1 Tax=Pseudochryseolinea flava TaxID=2059302 RepID=A0A364XV50_9BACT|nr:helix-turn-helix domain-containing protein [Pseudochryseolinea flava]RAV98038.1 hypothetical protein DQQ10_25890 [Pseudochryseolinea flava]